MKAFYGDDIITPVEQQLQPKNRTEAKEQNVIKNKYVALLFGGLISLLVIFLGYNEMHSGGTLGGIMILCFGVLCLVIVILGFIQTSLKEKTAQLMRAKANAVPGTNLKEPVIEPLLASNIPEFKLEVYEENELPDIAYTYNEHLTEEKNVFNIKPLKIFYFYNFYSSHEWEKKVAAGWQRHGPLFHLGSPDDIAISKFWKSYEVKKIVNDLLITSPKKLSEAIDNSSFKPLPPKAKGLMATNSTYGAYPTNLFLCTDAIWQECVELLFKKTDISIIDASDYTAERAGLQWEIHQIINHLPTEDFVVLINERTDLASLADSFRNTWKHMYATSPNNRDLSKPIRFVYYQDPDRSMGTAKYKNPLREFYWQQTLSNDRIISFLLQSEK